MSSFKSAFQRPPIKNLIAFASTAAGNVLAATAIAEQSRAIKLRAAMVVTTGVYALAVGGSAWLKVKAPILEGVPLWAGAALLLGFYTRLVLSRAVGFSALSKPCW